MSSISQTGENCHRIESASAVVNFVKPLVTFFKFKSVTRTPRIYYGDYSYQLMPDMAFVKPPANEITSGLSVTLMMT